MISVVICSRKKELNSAFSENIRNTIGCDFELITIDNSENRYSIFEAYNLGIQKSKGDLIAFIHDDIFIHSMQWGSHALQIFEKDKRVGLLGVAGAKLKTRMPSGWWNCPKEFKEINIIQHLNATQREHWNYGFSNGSLAEVAAIDGVFMIMKNGNDFFFNTELKGFHNYDLNISIVCKIKGFKILVTNEILIEHFSNGIINDSWYESSLRLHEIYKKWLPIQIGYCNPKVLKETELSNGNWFISKIFNLGFQKKAIGLWLQLLFLNPFSKFHLKFIKILIRNNIKPSTKTESI